MDSLLAGEYERHGLATFSSKHSKQRAELFFAFPSSCFHESCCVYEQHVYMGYERSEKATR